MRYTAEVDGTRVRLGALDLFRKREVPTLVRRILREKPGAVITIRPESLSTIPNTEHNVRGRNRDTSSS